MATVGTIQIPLYTRFGKEEITIGVLTLPVTFELTPGAASGVLDVHLDLTERA